MNVAYLYAFIIAIGLFWLFLLKQSAQDKGNFSGFLRAHGFFLNPFKWVILLLKYKTDPDVKNFVLKRFWGVCLAAHLLPFFVWLAVNYGWRDNSLADHNAVTAFVANLQLPALLITSLIIGTPVSNIYATKNFKLVPLAKVLEWGKFYRKDKRVGTLQRKIVEKFWYGALIRDALARKVGFGQNRFNFRLVQKPDSSVDIDNSFLPMCIGGPKQNVIIDTTGTLLAYDDFVSMLPELESYSGLRTISIARSGHNSRINFECSHKDLPSGIIPYNQVPRSADLRQINFGFTGKGWVGVKLGKDKNLLIAGNPGAGKSTIYENIIAGAPANAIFVIVDFLKDAIDFSMCKHDPFAKETLKAKVAAGEIIGDEYVRSRENLDPIPMLTVADSKARAITAFAWVYGELKTRINILGNVDENNIERIADDRIFKHPEKFPWIIVMLDEAAATAFAGKNDDKIAKIKTCIDQIAVTGRAVGIMMVQATQIPTVESVSSSGKMSTRGVYQWIALNMSSQHIKLLTGNNINVPGGNEQEFVGTFAKEHGDGYLFAKSAMIEPMQTAKIAWVRGNMSTSGKYREKVLSRLKNLVQENVINAQFADSLLCEGGPSDLGLQEWLELNSLVQTGTADWAINEIENLMDEK